MCCFVIDYVFLLFRVGSVVFCFVCEVLVLICVIRIILL